MGMNKPIRMVSIFCLMLILVLMVNVTYVQYWKADYYNARPENVRVMNEQFSRERGAILVGRTPVAESVPSEDQYKFQRLYSRPYQYAHMTGWFGYGNATSGLERAENSVLSGDDDRLFVTRLMDLINNKGVAGGDVTLTIDAQAQTAAYEALTTSPYGVRQGGVVAIEPSTGRILAMASTPSFDPNNLSTHDTAENQKAYEDLNADPLQPLVNRGAGLPLAPGSTFKLVTAAAAIENEGYVYDSQVPAGYSYQLPQTTGGGGLIENEGSSYCAPDTVSFSVAMARSCNTTFAQLAIEVGSKNLRKQAEAFGFNNDFVNDLGVNAAESTFPSKLNVPQTGMSGIGQYEDRATALQMAMVAAGIANDGQVMTPYLVDSIASADADVLDRTEPQPLTDDNAISADTAEILTQLMVDTVNTGTAYTGAIPGIKVAGKTGTAQSGKDSEGPYAWFTAFAPADNPRVAVAVMVQTADIASGEIAGGRVAGPIAKAVMEAVLG
ncbi:D,D-transpeptidase PbpA [soil metagenome]